MKTGLVFGEHISTERLGKRRHYGDIGPKLRTFVLPFSLFFCTSILLFRLVNLQLVEGSIYRTLADTNRTRTTVVHAPRGVIFDRTGKPLVFNKPGYRKTEKDGVVFLSQEEALERIAKGEEGLTIDTLREYPHKDAFAHVLGYVGQITADELKFPSFQEKNGGDVIGKIGIERQYESILSGIDGRNLVEVEATGKSLRTLGQTDPLPGGNITLTLDTDTQLAAYNALPKDKRGVVVASTPDGEILTLVSRPSFDPNLFTQGKAYTVATDAAYTKVSDIILDSVHQPLLDRAIGGAYPPGSTFKLITAAAALERHLIDEKFTVSDTGIIKIGAFSFANWYFTKYGRTDGEVDVIKGIARSNDIFFYKLGDMIGVEKLSQTARNFGLGKPLGIDLPGEVSGLVPTNEWKKRVIGEPWYLGDNYHYGIGQGYVLTTPLQVNTWTQALAKNGVLFKPHLLKSQKKEVMGKELVTQKNHALIRDGMIASCAPGGVAWPLFDFKVKNPDLKIDGKNILAVKPSSTSATITDVTEYRHIRVACKTGTAQHGGEETLPHAWITLYAPAYDPEIVVTVLVESAGEGSNEAAPVAKKVLEAWFQKK